MFDDVDDDDITEALPDSEMEIDEEEQRRLQRHKGRRMTVSEVSIFCFIIYLTFIFIFFFLSFLLFMIKI